MKEDEFGFDFSPHVEDIPDDMADLIDDDVIGKPSEYGFNSAEQMELYFENLVRADLAYEELQRQRTDKWNSIKDRYTEAGSVLYNPENGDEWYTDDPELDIEG